MKLCDFLCEKKVCITFAEVRRFVNQGAIKVNNTAAVSFDQEIATKDTISIGKRKSLVVD